MSLRKRNVTADPSLLQKVATDQRSEARRLAESNTTTAISMTEGLPLSHSQQKPAASAPYHWTTASAKPRPRAYQTSTTMPYPSRASRVRTVSSRASVLVIAAILLSCAALWVTQRSGVSPLRLVHRWISGSSRTDVRTDEIGGAVRNVLPESPLLWPALRSGVPSSSSRSRSLSSSSSSALRIMFLGDSITEGAAAHTGHHAFAEEGSCSYRYSFLNELIGNEARGLAAAAVGQEEDGRRTSRRRVRLVGPFNGTACGTLPPRCASSMIDSRYHNDLWFDTKHDISVHAATSGITLQQLREAKTAEKRRNVTRACKALRPNVYPDREDTKDEESDARRSVVKEWVASAMPDLVVILLGTNDIRWATAATPQQIVTEHFGPVVQSVLADSLLPNGKKEEEDSMCQRVVMIATLLRRRGELNDGVLQFNEELRQIQKHRRLVSAKKGAGCTADGKLQEDVLLCHPCLRILDLQEHVEGAVGGGERFLSEFTFDGLHPNDKGDVVVGRELAKLVMHA